MVGGGGAGVCLVGCKILYWLSSLVVDMTLFPNAVRLLVVVGGGGSQLGSRKS